MHLHRPARGLAILVAGTTLALTTSGALTAVAATSPSAARDVNTDGSYGTGVDSASAVVRLSRAPLARATATRPAQGKKIAFGSTKVKNYRATLRAQRSEFKQWLRTAAPKAKVTGEYDVAVNALAVRLHGTKLSTLRNGPGVASVSYQARYTPTSDDPDLSLINAEQAWAAATPNTADSNAGAGVLVGIVDTGIDATHPCFDDTGYSHVTQKGQTAYTNNKVIIARVFANKAAKYGYDAYAAQEHGTHVAGTVACNYKTPAEVDGAAIPYAPSGVAPRARLGNYNVFPGTILNARSEDILNALQAAAVDGVDVINMSLGGGAAGIQDLLTMAVDNLDRANIVSAVSAGNEGPGHFTTGSPGSAERALTAGASTVGHYVGIPVRSGGTTRAVAATSDFSPITSDITGVLTKSAGATATTLGTGCVDGTYTNATGKIALVSRGDCTFSQKVYYAEQAGAIAVIVVNNVPGDPIAMGTTASIPTTLSAVQVGLAKLATMLGLVGQTVTLGSDAQYVDSGFDNIMASFSSQGPTDVDYRVKPDLVAPGFNVLSSIPHQFCDTAASIGCWAFFSGTSMSSPHLAGTAAVVRQAHPTWYASQVRSAITNTAQEGLLTKYNDIAVAETDPQIVGAGLDDVLAAVNASLALSSVSVSFGAVPGRNVAAQTRTLVVTNLTGSSITVPVTESGGAFTVSASSLTIAAHGTAAVTVRFVPRNAVAGANYTTLRFGNLAHAVLYGFVK